MPDIPNDLCIKPFTLINKVTIFWIIMLLEHIWDADTYIIIWIACFPIPWTQHLSNLGSCCSCLILAFPRAPKIWVVIQEWCTVINWWPRLDPITCAHWPGIRIILARTFGIHEWMLSFVIYKITSSASLSQLHLKKEQSLQQSNFDIT